MRAKQREAIGVLLRLRSLRFPTSYRVTLRAIGTELSAMDIRVAIRALHADIFKLEIRVAERARNFFVHSEQGVASRIVIEFRNAANWFPAGIRVAVFAGDRKKAVRISRRALGARLRRGERCAEYEREEYKP